MRVHALALAALALHAAAPHTAKKLFVSRPCYGAYTAIVSDSATMRVLRIVTTGVRRFTNRDTGNGPACSVGDQQRAEQLKHAVTAELADDAARARWIIAESADSAIAGDHITRMQQMLRGSPAALVVHIAPDSDLVTLPTSR